MCRHVSGCAAASALDRESAPICVLQPTQGWALLCNGVVTFDDGGMLLPDGTAVDPPRAA
jgi:hypothetical protein